MPTVSITQVFITSAAAILLSLAVSYIPGLNTKFAAVTPEKKRLVMLGLMVLTSAIIFGLGCSKLLPTNIACSEAGLFQLSVNLFFAAVANQTTFSLSPQTQAVKMAKSQSSG